MNPSIEKSNELVMAVHQLRDSNVTLIRLIKRSSVHFDGFLLSMFWSTRVPPSITPKFIATSWYILPLPGSEPEQCDRHQQARILQGRGNSLRLLSPRNRSLKNRSEADEEFLWDAAQCKDVGLQSQSLAGFICATFHAVPLPLICQSPGYVIYAFKEGSIRVINQSAKDTEGSSRSAPSRKTACQKPLGRQDHFKLSNASKAIRSWPSYGKIPWFLPCNELWNGYVWKWGIPPNYSHLVGIMIINHWV